MAHVAEDPHLLVAFRALLVVVVAMSGLGKLLFGFREMREVVRAYRLLPEPLTGPVAFGLPFVELALAVGLSAPMSVSGPAASATLLFLAFAGAAGTNIMRGRRDIACGCFGARGGRHLSWQLVIADLALAACSAWLFVGAREVKAWPSLAQSVAIALVICAVIAAGGLLRSLVRLLRLTPPEEPAGHRHHGSADAPSVLRSGEGIRAFTSLLGIESGNGVKESSR